MLSQPVWWTMNATRTADMERQEQTEERVVAAVRSLARELRGDRAAGAVTATAFHFAGSRGRSSSIALRSMFVL